MYKVLYRAYRPEVFKEMLGQEHIVNILRNQIEKDTVNHAYLFCGTRGTGKTSAARLLAKGVNCTAEGERPCGVCENCKAIKEGNFIDIVEIDAASNNGVDNIRELRESVKYPPAKGKKRVYIVDEVHMLTKSSFNALLKTLEEPPEHVIFVLATTEPEGLPATILSRCMRMDFRRVPENTIVSGMKKICQEQKVQASEDALRLIAMNADGSVRDALTLLDQCIAGKNGTLERNDVLRSLGTVGEEVFIKMTDKVAMHDPSGGMILIEKALEEGKDPRQIMKGWMFHYRNLLLTKYMKDPSDMLNMSTENIERIREQSTRLDLEEINNGIIELAGIIAESKWSAQPRILLELCMVRMAARGAKGPFADPSLSREKNTNVKANQIPKKENENDKKTPETELKGGLALDKVWQCIFEDGEARKGSFNVIRRSAALESMTSDEFIISASNGVFGFVESNREIIEHLMEKHTGTRRRMKCISKNGNCSNNENDKEEVTASQLEGILGTDNIEIL